MSSRDSVVAIVWTSQHSWFYFPERLDRLWDPPSFLLTGYRGPFYRGGKAVGALGWLLIPCSAKVMHACCYNVYRVSVPSWLAHRTFLTIQNTSRACFEGICTFQMRFDFYDNDIERKM
jgi:hypothetical protein